MLTYQELNEWKHHPVTQEFIKRVRKVRQECLEDLAEGIYSYSDVGQTAMSHAKVLGQCQALMSIADMDWHQLFADIIEEEASKDEE